MRYVVCVLFGLLVVESKVTIRIKCPSTCYCDIYKNYRRANCSNQSLVTVESEYPVYSQILDLSYNQIHGIDDFVFKNMKLTSLKQLNISHNKVGQIQMRAFEGLSDLNILDLSYNVVQYILQTWFESMPHLKEFYLKGNDFSSLPMDVPIIESQSLEVLDIGECKIAHISRTLFSRLPNLVSLDVSKNHLSQLEPAVLRPLKRLKLLNAIDNTWKCNNVLAKLGEYCYKKDIQYTDQCKKNELGKKFERMINLPVETTSQENSWAFEVDSKSNENCLNVTHVIDLNPKRGTDTLLKIFEMSPWISLVIIFTCGLMTGLIIGCSVQIKSGKKAVRNHSRRRRCRAPNQTTSYFQNPLYQRVSLVGNCQTMGESTPVPLRRLTE